MPTYTSDMLGTIECTERAGVIVEARRVWTIEDVAGADAQSLLNAVLADTGLPKNGHTMTVNAQKVILEERSVRFYDTNCAQVALMYRRQDDTAFYIRGDSSVSQVQTELDNAGQQIIVEHDGIQQGGEVDVFEPQVTIEFDIVREGSTPGSFAKSLAGKVNSVSWQGADPGEWLCMSAAFDPVDLIAVPAKYRFRLVFQLRDGGWNPTVAYRDNETGRPPVGLVIGTGIKTVDYYTAADFDSIINP